MIKVIHTINMDWRKTMEKDIINKKLKRVTLVFNLLQVFALVFLEAVLYTFVSYRKYLLLDYIPIKYLILLELLLVIITIIPFLIKWGKKRMIGSMVISVIMSIVMIVTGILGIAFRNEIKNFIDKFDSTIEKVVDNSLMNSDEYGVYVLKDDPAERIEDAKDYKFGYVDKYLPKEINTVIDTIEMTVARSITKKASSDAPQLADDLLDKKVKAIILNQALVDIIEDDEDNKKSSNSRYADFAKKIKCIYTINIKTEMAKIADEDMTKKCFLLYISGIDTDGSVTAKSRSDVNIILSVNPVTHQIVMVSTPRDYYVPLSISNGVRDKLTHAGNYGIDVSMDTLEMLYDVEIKYYFRLNFTGFVDIIDVLGGIDVESDYSFSTHGYSYNEGLNSNLSGIQALWFARERHAFAAGDKQRGKDQMKVIEAVIKKCQTTALLKNYNSILNEVSESFQTNVSKKNIKRLVKMQLNNTTDWKIFSFSVTGTGQSNYTYTVPSKRAYVMVPDETSVEKAKRLFEKNKFNQTINEDEVPTGIQ